MGCYTGSAMAFLCPVRFRRGKRKKARDTGRLPLMGRITGSASIDTLVRVGLEKEDLYRSAESAKHPTMVVIRDFQPCVEDELSVVTGTRVTMLYCDGEWIYVVSEDGREGFVPYAYCSPLPANQDTSLSPSSIKRPAAPPDYENVIQIRDKVVAGALQRNNSLSMPSLNSIEKNESRLPEVETEAEVVQTFDKHHCGKFIVLFDFVAQQENDLNVNRGEFVTVLNKDDTEWFWIMRSDKREGFVPRAFLCPADGQATEDVLGLSHHPNVPRKDDRAVVTTPGLYAEIVKNQNHILSPSLSSRQHNSSIISSTMPGSPKSSSNTHSSAKPLMHHSSPKLSTPMNQHFAAKPPSLAHSSPKPSSRVNGYPRHHVHQTQSLVHNSINVSHTRHLSLDSGGSHRPPPVFHSSPKVPHPRHNSLDSGGPVAPPPVVHTSPMISRNSNMSLDSEVPARSPFHKSTTCNDPLLSPRKKEKDFDIFNRSDENIEHSQESRIYVQMNPNPETALHEAEYVKSRGRQSGGAVRAVCLRDYQARGPDDITVARGDAVYVASDPTINRQDSRWLWVYSPASRRAGYLPSSHVRRPQQSPEAANSHSTNIMPANKFRDPYLSP